MERHRMQFSKCLQELPFIVGAFYYAINETIANDYGCRDEKTVHIDELYDHYLYRADVPIESISKSMPKDTIESLTRKPYSYFEERAIKYKSSNTPLDFVIIEQVVCFLEDVIEDTWNIGRLAFLLDKDYKR